MQAKLHRRAGSQGGGDSGKPELLSEKRDKVAHVSEDGVLSLGQPGGEAGINCWQVSVLWVGQPCQSMVSARVELTWGQHDSSSHPLSGKWCGRQGGHGICMHFEDANSRWRRGGTCAVHRTGRVTVFPIYTSPQDVTMRLQPPKPYLGPSLPDLLNKHPGNEPE